MSHASGIIRYIIQLHGWQTLMRSRTNAIVDEFEDFIKVSLGSKLSLGCVRKPLEDIYSYQTTNSRYPFWALPGRRGTLRTKRERERRPGGLLVLCRMRLMRLLPRVRTYQCLLELTPVVLNWTLSFRTIETTRFCSINRLHADSYSS
jgi:hypothetical protein